MMHRRFSSDPADPEVIRDLLADQLRDLLHAEKQLQKAIPKMVKAANSEQLSHLLEIHLNETDSQVERLGSALEIIGAQGRAKPCRGMMGLIEEGEEVMRKGGRMEAAAADLALIGAAQKVEHYEISAYTSARNLAYQLHDPELAALLRLPWLRSRTLISCLTSFRGPFYRFHACLLPLNETPQHGRQGAAPIRTRGTPSFFEALKFLKMRPDIELKPADGRSSVINRQPPDSGETNGSISVRQA
jgi:ferritin-like metal-binding protein YciE